MEASNLKLLPSNLQPLSSTLKLSTLWPPTVSIIIPTLNSEKTLKDCLESIVIQDYPKDKIEIIFADGGSTDRENGK